MRIQAKRRTIKYVFQTLVDIVGDNYRWGKQIFRLAKFELVKKSRGAVLSWAWFFIKPAVYIFCFWFALEIGLRAGGVAEGAPPYILWLCAGLIPWFFMQEILGAGIDVFHRYPYLVSKIKFPLSGISTVYTMAMLFVQLMLQAGLLVIYFACGQGPDIHLLQIPLLLLMLFFFWDIFSMLCSQLSAMSKDFFNMMKALSTPFFWLSGVIFNVENIQIDWLRTTLDFNPITFFARAFRAAYYDKVWFWEDTSALIGFCVVFLVTLVCMLLIYKKLHKEVADVF